MLLKRLCLLLALAASQAFAATGAHLVGSTVYPRLIRLHHAPATLRNTLLAKTGNKLFRSLDEGRTFTYLATVPTVPESNATAPDTERCCSTIFELPVDIGRFKAGTILYAGSFLSNSIPAVEIYTSTDGGAHWQYLATPHKAGSKAKEDGLWEPEFTVAADNSLVMFVSDETDRCCSQKLVQMRTTDLAQWSPRRDTVASLSQKDRPGMAVISKLPGGTYFMSYEICGPATHCQAYFRTSRDGLDYGRPSDLGTLVISAAGQHFAHAPASIWDATAHQILLVGQVLNKADGTVDAKNGALIFVHSPDNLAAPWLTQPAPVEVPSAYDNFCPNYSSALMPTPGGLLELASDYDATHQCTSYFATAPIR